MSFQNALVCKSIAQAASKEKIGKKPCVIAIECVGDIRRDGKRLIMVKDYVVSVDVGQLVSGELSLRRCDAYRFGTNIREIKSGPPWSLAVFRASLNAIGMSMTVIERRENHRVAELAEVETSSGRFIKGIGCQTQV